MTSITQLKAVEQATVEFSESQITLTWSESDGFLLDFAEQHDIPVLSSCRNGHCGACAVQLLTGDVVHQKDISVDLGGSDILLCSAKPASSYIKIRI